MSNITDYLANALLDHSFGEGSYAEPTTYCGLFTAAPTMPAGTGGTEVSTGSYGRVALAGLMGAAVSQVIENSSTITFPTATADWGTIVWVGIWDASTGGNLLYAGPLTTPQTVTTGNTFAFPTSDLQCSMT